MCDVPIETVKYILVNIWRMLGWILSQNCRNTLPLHTVDLFRAMLVFFAMLFENFLMHWYKLCNADAVKLKDTNMEKTPSNKTSALTKSTNMDIWVVGTSNQLFVRGS